MFSAKVKEHMAEDARSFKVSGAIGAAKPVEKSRLQTGPECAVGPRCFIAFG